MLIEVDFNDIRSVVKIKKMLLKQERKLITEQGIKNRWQALEDQHFEKIYTRMEQIYQQYQSEPGNYYVYAHCNPCSKLNARKTPQHLFCATHLKLSNVPFYIGKGTGDRCYQLKRNETHKKIRSKILEAGLEVEIIKIVEGLSEESALDLEARIIDILGLKVLHHNNLLVNLDEGINKEERRISYPKSAMWLLNRNKMRLYQNNHSL